MSGGFRSFYYHRVLVAISFFFSFLQLHNQLLLQRLLLTFITEWYKPVVLNIWVVTPTGIIYQIVCLSDTYTLIHPSSKISYKTVIK